MRRMLTNKNVVDVVNKAIDDGEIEVGGSLPEIQEGDAGKALVVNEQEDGVEWAEVGAPDNVLVLPESAPAAQQLVGINTSNEQNSLSIGDGLEIANGQLQISKVLTLDFNGGNSTTTTTAIAGKIENKEYNYIVVNNFKSSGRTVTLLPCSNSNRYRGVIFSTSASATQFSGGSNTSLVYYEIYANSGTGNVSGTDTTWKAAEYKGTTLIGTSGTLTTTENGDLNNGLILQRLYTYAVSTETQSIKSIVHWEMIDKTNNIAVGKAVLYDSTGTTATSYKIIVNLW